MYDTCHKLIAFIFFSLPYNPKKTLEYENYS